MTDTYFQPRLYVSGCKCRAHKTLIWRKNWCKTLVNNNVAQVVYLNKDLSHRDEGSAELLLNWQTSEELPIRQHRVNEPLRLCSCQTERSENKDFIEKTWFICKKHALHNMKSQCIILCHKRFKLLTDQVVLIASVTSFYYIWHLGLECVTVLPVSHDVPAGCHLCYSSCSSMYGRNQPEETTDDSNNQRVRPQCRFTLLHVLISKCRNVKEKTYYVQINVQKNIYYWIIITDAAYITLM